VHSLTVFWIASHQWRNKISLGIPDGPQIDFVDKDLSALDEQQGEILVLSVFIDERPLEGLTGLVDWRLRGALSKWFIGGFATGAWGERVLYPIDSRLNFSSILLFGLGHRTEHRADRALAVARTALESASSLNASSLTCGLFGLEELPSPLARTGRQLLDLLKSTDKLDKITLVTRPKEREILKAQLFSEL
jgi:hypothetical protein